MHLVKKGIIPAAGLGTRMLPLTKGTPKEMLTVGSKPMIQHAVEMNLASGIREICIIINPKKTVIRDFLVEQCNTYASYKPRLDFLYQPQPKGLADAIYLAKGFIDNEPFALTMPDAILFSETPAIAQLIHAFLKYNQDMVGVIHVGHEEIHLYGNVGVLDIAYIEEDVIKVNSYSNKRPGRLKVQLGQRIAKSFGVGIYLPHYFDHIDAVRPTINDELDDVPVLQRLIQDKGLLGLLIRGRAFDVGNPDGYQAANSYLNLLNTHHFRNPLL